MGQGGGFNLGSLLGHGKESADSSGLANGMGAGMNAGMGAGMGAGMSAAMSLMPGMSMIPGLGGLPMGNLLNTTLPGGINLQGINGPVGGMGGGPLGMLGMLGGKGGLMGGLLGHAGIGGLFAHGGLLTSGGSLGGLGAALPWLGGGLLLNSILGNPFKKLFKHFHFAKGAWSVPGHGTGDTVPAMLTPGEMVLPVSGANRVRQALSGHGEVRDGKIPGVMMKGQNTPAPIHITVHHHGDINNQADGESFHTNTAMMIKQQLPVTTPGT